MDAEQIVVTASTEALLDGVEPAGWRYTYPDDKSTYYATNKQGRHPEWEGWTETTLYTRAQVLAAVEADRAAIVAWLRNEGTLQIDTGYDAGVYGGQGMRFAASQIEARAYLPPTITGHPAMTEATLERLRGIHRRNRDEYDEVCAIIDEVRALARHRTLTPAQAAGPVLLEAAKLIVADCSYHLQKYRPAQLQELRAAIAQAEGPQA